MEIKEEYLKEALYSHGFRLFENSARFIAYRRVFKDGFVLTIALTKEGWVGCLVVGKVEILVPGFITKKWLIEFCEKNK